MKISSLSQSVAICSLGTVVSSAGLSLAILSMGPLPIDGTLSLGMIIPALVGSVAMVLWVSLCRGPSRDGLAAGFALTVATILMIEGSAGLFSNSTWFDSMTGVDNAVRLRTLLWFVWFLSAGRVIVSGLARPLLAGQTARWIATSQWAIGVLVALGVHPLLSPIAVGGVVGYLLFNGAIGRGRVAIGLIALLLIAATAVFGSNLWDSPLGYAAMALLLCAPLIMWAVHLRLWQRLFPIRQ